MNELEDARTGPSLADYFDRYCQALDEGCSGICKEIQKDVRGYIKRDETTPEALRALRKKYDQPHLYGCHAHVHEFVNAVLAVHERRVSLEAIAKAEQEGMN